MIPLSSPISTPPVALFFVDFNYRVGTWGFFNTGGPDAPGNYALWDILRLLQWVQAEIPALGGLNSPRGLSGDSPPPPSTPPPSPSPHSPTDSSNNSFCRADPPTYPPCLSTISRLGFAGREQSRS